MSNVSKASTSVKKKTIYRVKNWATYNRSLIARGSLTLWVDESVVSSWYYEGPSQRGAQYTYSDQAIEMALTRRRLLNLPLRQTQGFVESLWTLMGLEEVLAVPDYSTLSRRQGTLKVALPVQPTDGPMHLVVDSTGLKVYGEGEWTARQHGASTRRTWRKLHLAINANTQDIVAQQLTKAYAADARQLKPLLRQIDTPIERCYAD
ncbi:MAG TPA: IS5 family transposase, partial [Candidatus Handelsmanbacteria bacterium]|nr:IS5 family transposase [Candidatus Handelsmanbacteria bacterium]